MPHCANELLEETPVGGSCATASVLVSVVVALGLQGLAIVGLFLISPGCGQPT